MQAPVHEPVLLHEAVEALRIAPAGRYVDCTYGRGGHSRAILARLGPQGRLLAIDRDPEAVAAAALVAAREPRLVAVHGRFGALAEIAARSGFPAVDGVLLDLGLSSPQLAQPARGFSFTTEGPLDMRMDPGEPLDAAAWLARAREREIADTLFHFGEERHARRIARAIVAARARRPIATTAELAALVARVVPRGRGRIHPATRTFQALRMRVNDELGELAAVLGQAVALLAPGGRLVVISFHSLEDRLVKRFLRAEARPEGEPPPAPRLRLVGKLVRPGAAECARNPRSRSARMRIAERLPAGDRQR